LSYAFRPRRKRKSSPTSPVKHRFKLQALALRTGKTYLHEPPALVRQQPEIFLDFEGIPDRDTQYLLGLLVRQHDDVRYHAFWADTDADEARIWQKLLTTLAAYPDGPQYHYGQYEARAIRLLLKRYQAADDPLLGRLVSLNAYVYGKVYFPVRSNRLKDIGRWLGVSWPTTEVSGIDSLLWRHRWDQSHDDADKQLLLAYNEADCHALRVLADELTRLRDTGAEDPSVDSSTPPKQYATDTGRQLHREFETILRSAHAEYEHTKIGLRRDQTATPDDDKRRVGGQPGHPGNYRTPPKATRVVRVSPAQESLRCGHRPLLTTAKLSDKTIVDLAFHGQRLSEDRHEVRWGQSLLPPMCWAVLRSASNWCTPRVCLRARLASLGHLPASGAALALPRNHSSGRGPIPCAREREHHRRLYPLLCARLC
jgi:hypothetical protein